MTCNPDGYDFALTRANVQGKIGLTDLGDAHIVNEGTGTIDIFTTTEIVFPPLTTGYVSEVGVYLLKNILTECVCAGFASVCFLLIVYAVI